MRIKKYQMGGKAKKPVKYYSEKAVGKGDFSKPRTEKEQKKWEADELKMVDYSGRPSADTTSRKVKKPVKKMKSGGKTFPDLNKDGKVTKADVLVGRGVIKAKKGVKLKKAQDGTKTPPKVNLRTGQLKRIGRLSAKNPDKAQKVGAKMIERATRRERGKEYIKKNYAELIPKTRKGGSIKKCRYGCK